MRFHAAYVNAPHTAHITGTATSVAAVPCISDLSYTSCRRVGRTGSLGLRGHLDEARGARGARRVEADGTLASGHGRAECKAGEHFESRSVRNRSVYVFQVPSRM
jgi:hypothetical protein